MARIEAAGRAALGVVLVCVVAFLSPAVLAQGGSPTVQPSPSPGVDLSAVGGKGEGRLALIAGPGDAEDGTTLPEYDWISGFTDATRCRVTVKVDTSSEMMLKDVRSGDFDGVLAPGDVALGLIAAGDVAEIDVTTIPGFSDVMPFLTDAPHYVVDGKHFGVPQGWVGHKLMYNADVVTPPPTSWDVVFDPAKAAVHAGRVSAYDSAMSIADAALYLKTGQPGLGITDIYELTESQLDAAVGLLRSRTAVVGQYWSKPGVQIADFANGTSVVGSTWPYQLTTLAAAGLPVASVIPTEGITGRADTWMMSRDAAHPHCMQKWMAWMLRPEIQAQVAEYSGKAPANSKACPYLDVGIGAYRVPGFCDQYGEYDTALHDSISFWKTPQTSCGDARGDTCTDYDLWANKWTEIRGG